jgi:predicted ATPase
MELCRSNVEAMEKLTETVLTHAHTTLDKIQANATRIYGLGLSDRPNDALDLGIEVLKEVDERFPFILCKQHLMGEVCIVKRLLNGRTNTQLLRLPAITDPEKLASLQILNHMFLQALLVRPKLSGFITLKMLRMTLEDGLSMIAPVAFACYGMLCVSAMGDVDAGWRFGELGIELLEQLSAWEYIPRVYAAFYGCIYPWRKPLRETIEPIGHAQRVGMQTGDAEFGGLCANLQKFSLIDSGVPLDRIEAEWTSIREMMVTQRQLGSLRMSLPCLQVLHHYMGVTEDPLASKGDLLDYDELLQYCIENRLTNTVNGLKVSRMMLAYYFNDYALADQLGGCLSTKEIWSTAPTLNSAVAIFFSGLVALARARERKDYRRNIRKAKQVLKLLKGFTRNCPWNFLEKKYLLEAELASVCGDGAKAVEKYISAIAVAKEMQFLQIRALANERLARHYVYRGHVAEAAPYFREAITLYTEWSGHAKARRLAAEVEALYVGDETHT